MSELKARIRKCGNHVEKAMWLLNDIGANTYFGLDKNKQGEIVELTDALEELLHRLIILRDEV